MAASTNQYLVSVVCSNSARRLYGFWLPTSRGFAAASPSRTQSLQPPLPGSCAIIHASLGDMHIFGTAHAAAVLRTCNQTLVAQYGGSGGHRTHTHGNVEGREIRTPHLLIWSQTRYRCAIPPFTTLRIQLSACMQSTKSQGSRQKPVIGC